MNTHPVDSSYYYSSVQEAATARQEEAEQQNTVQSIIDTVTISAQAQIATTQLYEISQTAMENEYASEDDSSNVPEATNVVINEPMAFNHLMKEHYNSQGNGYNPEPSPYEGRLLAVA